MDADTMLHEIEENLDVVNTGKLIKVWNLIFPVEEYINKETISNDELLIDEIREIIMDEIIDYDAKQLLRVFNLVTGKKISFDDLLYDDSL